MQTKNLIDGRWVAAQSGDEVAVLDPATDEELARVPSGGAADARTAIDAAHGAFPSWSALPASKRAKVLRRVFDLMTEHRDELARTMTREQGKPLAEARAEIAYAASFVEWAAEEGKRLYGEVVPASQSDKRILVLRQPLGVTASITPWNFPAAMITRKLGPALATGCTMVVKPAEQTPLTALALGELFVEAGIPPGVVNIVTGDAEAIAGELLSDPRVRKLSFTGSTEVGRILMRNASQNLTRLSLELGGHAPFVVFDDADLEAAVGGLVANKFRNAGQTCICANRVLVQDAVHDRFVDMLVDAVRSLKVGSGLDDGVKVGPLIDDDGLAKVERHVKDAVERGARIRCGGERVRIDGLADRFFAPTVLEGSDGDMLVFREETFGPVVPVRRFATEQEGIEAANDSPFGLAAYFYARDVRRVMRVAEALEYGIVGVNDGAPSTAQAPFGGVKHSGFGREGGRWVMEEYVNVKYVSLGL